MPLQVRHEKFIGLFFYSLDAMVRGMNLMEQKPGGSGPVLSD